MRRLSQVTTPYTLFEFALFAVTAFAAGAGYEHLALGWSQSWTNLIIEPLGVAAAVVLFSLTRGHYDAVLKLTVPAFMLSGLTACLKGFALVLATIFLTKTSEDLSRGGLVLQFFAVATAAVCARGQMALSVRRMVARGRLAAKRVMVVGRDPAGDEETLAFARTLAKGGDQIVQMVAWPSRPSGEAEGFLRQTVQDCRANQVDVVIIIEASERLAIARRLAEALSETAATVMIHPLSSFAGADIRVRRLITASTAPVGELGKLLKRTVDVAVSGLMLFLLSPLLIGVAIAIRLDSPGPVLFRQFRHGYNGQRFRVFKFRSMRVMEDGAAFRQATKNDSRITKIGRFIRRTNIDELPQLLNVLIGDMSLVGPRPHPIALNDDFSARIRLFHRRHNILPGITGWAQVNGLRGETDTEDKMRSRVEHDIWYIDNWSLALDFRIMLLTLFSSAAYRNAG